MLISFELFGFDDAYYFLIAAATSYMLSGYYSLYPVSYTHLLACIMVIVGIKHLNDIPCQVFLLYGLLVIPFIKGFQLEAFHRLRIPDAQGIHLSLIHI